MSGREPLLWRWWEQNTGLWGSATQMVTLPLELGVRAVTALRNRHYDRHRQEPAVGVPVVSVGNLTVGGTGKTPIAGWVMSFLRERGRRPGLVLRGYGNDEVALHRRWSQDGIVIVNPDRRAGARAAVAAGADVVVLDDGFQHRRLHRDLDLVLVSAEQHRAVARGRVLPRGPLREPERALRRADAVIITHRVSDPVPTRTWVQEHAPGVEVLSAALNPAGWTTLSGGSVSPPEGPVVALSSVAIPTTFWALLEGQGIATADTKAYPDHHDYTAQDIQEILAWADGRTLVTTEKDAVKLAATEAGDWRVLMLDVDFGPDLDRVTALIEEALV